MSQMIDTVLQWLTDPSGLTPHGFCLLWEPGLIWTHALSDGAIGLAYFSIPIGLAMVARRRRDLVFRPLFWLFAAFILLCGAGHWLDLLTLWLPLYGVQATVKVTTAVVSVVTAAILWRLLPEALALPSPEQLRLTTEALRESEAHHRASFTNSPVPLHTLDGQGVITGVSGSWLKLLGYAPEEVIGRHIGSFQEPEATWADADPGLMIGDAVEFERRFVRRDGVVLDTLVSVRTERRAGETAIVGAVIDISARRRAEAALRASEDNLRQAQKLQAIGQLSGGIAHDLNNMLQGIAGCLDVIEARIEKGRTAETPRFVSEARHSVERAASLTHRMLAFARRQALQPRAIDVGALVTGMGELIRRTVGPAVSVQVKLGGSDQCALCDANQLENALLNLAINARDAMPDGGALTITTGECRFSAADLARHGGTDGDGAEPGNYIEVVVSDTGTGMAPEVMERAFEPFFTTKEIGKGTGLGLSQTYGFVRQSGGMVRLESAAGHGTSVQLYLPRCGQDEAALPPPPVSANKAMGGGIGGCTALVVEDEPIIRAMIREALQEQGCTVIEAADGAAGSRLLQSMDRLDLLVTDVGLPVVNGRQVAELARSIWPMLPVLLITGYAGTAFETAGLPPGMEVLQKPFALGEFAGRVSVMMEAAFAR